MIPELPNTKTLDPIKSEYTTARISRGRYSFLQSMQITHGASSIDDAIRMLIYKVYELSPEWTKKPTDEESTERTYTVRITPSRLKNLIKMSIKELQEENLLVEGWFK